ncbi:Trk system potassium uptake protein TrkH [Roseivivax marinus]|jgi:trk system potassium uptake protein TrkH|uniref:Trk system potassium uptake protein TrkH n=1 Tax=Roseivivax marinus TaxID=1379903 RepID=W4HNV1_9RHOB|nr:potassium transporter TrkG [Roseivivax marinus]ETW14407.1 Trk system potassium uptake protein TrkH [Roseivivax marinus]UMA66360.1 TrkH family potassium uptake protein [Roseivivax marinus]SEL37436.1 trk system potassium uptake protein TrkH [Roseivivax marinus]
MRAITALPLLLLLTGLFSASMMVPAAVALSQEAFHDARSFFYSGLTGMVVVALIGVAVAGRAHNRNPMRQLLALAVGYLMLPAILAVPFHEAVSNTTFVNAYVEMTSSLTTTGATLFAPGRLSMAEHLWRAQVGWMGGALLWVSAAAILAPLTLGGFEVTAASEPGQTPAPGAAHRDHADPRQRLTRAAVALLPIYIGLTVILWTLLYASGDDAFVALCHAMATLATSGISPVGGLSGGEAGIAGEIAVLGFMLFGLSRLTFSNDTSAARRAGLLYDPEFRLGLIIVVGVPTLLFLRHWLASFDVGEEEDFLAAARAFWGGLFTTLSFLTTTGFESGEWLRAQGWSGLETPGLILMGLAILGGGVATTAGGVKLLRVFILYLAGRRELEKLIHPNSIGRSGLLSRRTRREGAFIAWVFFMIFAVTLMATVLGLAATGLRFEPAFVVAIAALTNTGPLVVFATEMPVVIAQYGVPAKMIFSIAMVLGRLEVLALVVMVTPDLWRD